MFWDLEKKRPGSQEENTMSFYKDNRDKQKKFYSSTKWIKCRKAYASEHPICERCILKGIVTPVYIVHHKIEVTEENVNDPQITLNPDNLESLCLECHNAEHFSQSITADGLYFDENGELQQKPKEPKQDS